MRNVDTEVSEDGTWLDIRIDLTKDFGPSQSGKTIIIASTDGNHVVAPGIMLGLNLYKKRS